VFVSPILVGGGIIVKILDAMAAGIPVVTTKYGNEGIGAMSGEEVLVADATDTYADAVVRLLSDPEANRRIGERGRDFVRGAYSAEAIGRIVLKTYQELLSARCSEAGGTG
jgi:glycosyltransferase involved in cell wall biosynthesis